MSVAITINRHVDQLLYYLLEGLVDLFIIGFNLENSILNLAQL